MTLYMSMVLMMMAGVVRKKRRKKRKVLITMKRAHQWRRRTDRCFLGRGGGRRRAQGPGARPRPARTQPAAAVSFSPVGADPALDLLRAIRPFVKAPNG